MNEQINVNIEKLIELDEGLNKTISIVDFVIEEQEQLIHRVESKISDVLYIWRAEYEKAWKDLEHAQEELESAERRARYSDSGEVPSYYYENVSHCKIIYDKVNAVYDKVKQIYDEFKSDVYSFRSDICTTRQYYLHVLKKSADVLTQYADFVAKSVVVIFGEYSGYVFGSNHLGLGSFDEKTNTHFWLDEVGRYPDDIESLYELSHTEQNWSTNQRGCLIFDSPVETGMRLDSVQGKYKNFLGTCGLVACENILRLAGYNATEEEIVRYASTHEDKYRRGKLCLTRFFPEDKGGTNLSSIKQILEHFGVKSSIEVSTTANIAKAVSEGRGVIIVVYAGVLARRASNHKDLHAVVVTSVVKDKNGTVLGFYACNPTAKGGGNSNYYTAFEVEKALAGERMCVTSVIR